jgi:hypothetical protein
MPKADQRGNVDGNSGDFMTGTFFNYEAGRIDARFSHDTKFDYINLDISMEGANTTTTECDEEGRLAEPKNWQKDGVEFAVYMSSVLCPFRDFIRFLEAITIEVQECRFHWDAEGPEGVIRWTRRVIGDTGFLTVEWSSEESFSNSMMLNTRQAVRTLYGAFRTFVESPDYDPLRYEQLTYGESIALVLSSVSLETLADTLGQLSESAAEAAIQRLRDAAQCRRSGGPKMTFTIEQFLEGTEATANFYDCKALIPADWNSLNQAHRVSSLKAIFDYQESSWFGTNLRALRSKLVEDWLALPEPPLSQTRRTPIATVGDTSIAPQR